MNEKNRFYNPFEMLKYMEMDEVSTKPLRNNTRVINRTGTVDIEKLTTTKTVILAGENELIKSFLEIKDGDLKLINKTPFILGKSKAADVCIESKVISRVHASIVVVNNNYYIIDNNSTNGTYINGIRIEPNKKIPLKKNDVIKLANVEIIFR